MSMAQATPAASSRLMTVEEVAQFLHISRDQAYLLVHERGFPLIELGPRMLRIDPRRLESWLQGKAAKG